MLRQGWMTEYDCCVQFPYNANYPPLGSQPPIITSCISYLPEPCDNTALSHLGDITFDATKPTLTITKVSEQRGDPSTTRRKLHQTSSQPLFALMLFNFSKPSGFTRLPIMDATIVNAL